MVAVRNAWKMLPNKKAVRLTLKSAAGIVLEVGGCVKRPLDRRQIDFAVSMGWSSATATFLLPVVNCKGREPLANDGIEQACGARWTILGVRTELEESIYRAFVRENP